MASGGGRRRAPGRAPEAAPPAARPGGSDGSMVAGWGQVPVPAVGEGLEIDSEGIGFGRYAVVLVEVSEAGALRFQAAGLADMAWRRSPKAPGGDGPMVALLPGCGKVSEMSLEIDGEDSRFVLQEVEASGAGVIPAPGVRFEAAGLVEEAVLRDLIRLTPVQPVAAPGRGAAACAQALSGKTAVLVSELVPGAEEARGGSGTPCGLQGPFAGAAKLRGCLLPCNREGTDEQLFVKMVPVSRTCLADDIKYLLMVDSNRMPTMEFEPVMRQPMFYIDTIPPEIVQISDMTAPAPVVVIDQDPDSDATDVKLQRGVCSKVSFCGYYNYSFQSEARVSLFAVIMFLLIVPSTQLPTINTSNTCPAPYLHSPQSVFVDTSNICPAPYLHASQMQFKRQVPGARPLFELEDILGTHIILTSKNECLELSSVVQWILLAAAGISFLANFAPLLPAIRITNAPPRRILLLGLSSVLLVEANVSWLLYFPGENCATGPTYGLASVACLVMSACYSIWFWWNSTLTKKYSCLLLAVFVTIGFLVNANQKEAGTFGLIFTAVSHIARITSALLDAQEYHWILLLLALCGTTSGSVFYTRDFKNMTPYKIASVVTFCARLVDVMMQLFFCCCLIDQDDINDVLHQALLQVAEDQQVG